MSGKYIANEKQRKSALKYSTESKTKRLKLI
jgi:hypothetical protein